MASPQLENGYTRIANELLERIYSYPFTANQSRILWFVIRQTYGFGLKERRLTLDWMAERLPIDRADISRARGQLLRLHVLGKSQQDGKEVIGLNKNYAEWTLPDMLGKSQPNVGKVPTEHVGEVPPITTKKGPTKKELPSGPIGPPQPPRKQHKPFHHISWGFYLKRKELLQDDFYNPYEAKNLKLCKAIVEERARGNLDEVRRRFSALCRLARPGNGFWNLTPAELSSKWDRLGDEAAKAAPGAGNEWLPELGAS